MREQRDLSRTDFCPHPMPRNRKNRAGQAPLHSAYRGRGSQRWRPPDSQPARLPQHAGAARPAPRESTLRVSAFTGSARKSPAGRAPRRALSGESRERSPALRHLPEASGPGARVRDLWAVQVGLELEAAAKASPQRPSPNTSLPKPESCPAEFLLIFA